MESNHRPSGYEPEMQPLHFLAIMTRRLAVFECGSRARCPNYQQPLHCIIRPYGLLSAPPYLGHNLVKRMQERRVGVFDKRRTVQKCNGLVVVGDAQPVVECTRAGLYYSSGVLIAGQPLLQNVNVHVLCARRDSNSHAVKQQILGLVCLPIPPLAHFG